jgi:hypothetical protein
MNETQKMRVAQWIDALRSGNFTQTTGALKNLKGHCCLGVLCEAVVGKPELDADMEYVYTSGGAKHITDIGWEEFERLTGFAANVECVLVGANDMARLSFDEIADLITIAAEDPTAFDGLTAPDFV